MSASGFDLASGGPERLEHDVPVRIEHVEVERLDHERGAEVPFRERPAYEFRQQYAEQFVDGTQWRAEKPITPFSAPDRLVEEINPHFGEPSNAYDVNCADCARSFEQSWRGQFEEAAGRAPVIAPEGGLRPTGEPTAMTEVWAGDDLRSADDTEALRSTLEQAGHGASAIVHTQYTDFNGEHGGHAFNVVNHHGEIRVCDAQRHATFAWNPQTIHRELDGLPTTHRAIAWNDHGGRIW